MLERKDVSAYVAGKPNIRDVRSKKYRSYFCVGDGCILSSMIRVIVIIKSEV